jgi:hypothetical protein
MMIRAVQCGPDRARHLLGEIQSDKTDLNRTVDLAQVIAAGSAYAVMDDAGNAVAAYVLVPIGPLLWISAAAGRASFDLSGVIDALVTAQGREFDQVGFRTERRGLVRKAERLGYTVRFRDGPAYFLRKNIAR